jgi:hypothetical protein
MNEYDVWQLAPDRPWEVGVQVVDANGDLQWKVESRHPTEAAALERAERLNRHILIDFTLDALHHWAKLDSRRRAAHANPDGMPHAEHRLKEFLPAAADLLDDLGSNSTPLDRLPVGGDWTEVHATLCQARRRLGRRAPSRPPGGPEGGGGPGGDEATTADAPPPRQVAGPLSITLDLREWKATRNGVTADFAGKEYPWKILRQLCRSYPSSLPAVDFVSAVWGRGEGSTGTLQAHLTAVRALIKPLGLSVLNTRKVGYKLAESPS